MIQILIFLLSVGILITIHELGHYFFARLFKVKVLVFCIGFGPKLFGFKTKSNEWRISAIPLGGYVQMFDENAPTSLSLTDQEKKMAFNSKPAYQKILIAFGGPLFNILFAIIIYYFFASSGVQQLKPIIADINPSIVKANHIDLKPGDNIQKINNILVTSWSSADDLFESLAKNSNVVHLQVKNKGVVRNVNLNLTELKTRYPDTLYLETLGFYPISYLPVISYIEPHSVAYSLGLKVNDRIAKVNGQEMKNWFELAAIIKSSPGEQLATEIIRDHETIKLSIVPSTENSQGNLIGKLGIMPSIDEDQLQKNTFIQKYDSLAALSYAASACYNLVSLNLSGLMSIISGKSSIYNLGGPVSIAKVGAGAFGAGFKQFFSFLALISMGLAVINLLPIPALDGGHILIYVIEWIRGDKIPTSIQTLIFKLGFIFVISISLIAIYNDILRF